MTKVSKRDKALLLGSDVRVYVREDRLVYKDGVIVEVKIEGDAVGVTNLTDVQKLIRTGLTHRIVGVGRRLLFYGSGKTHATLELNVIEADAEEPKIPEATGDLQGVYDFPAELYEGLLAATRKGYREPEFYRSVLFDTDGSIVATDGFRLHGLKTDIRPSERRAYLVSDLLSLKALSPEQIFFANTGHLVVSGKGWRVAIPESMIGYPDWRRVYPEDVKPSITFIRSVDDLKEVLTAVTKLGVKNNRVWLDGDTVFADNEWAKIKVKAREVVDWPGKTAFDAKFLLETLNWCGMDGVMVERRTNPRETVWFENGDRFAVIVPLRI